MEIRNVNRAQLCQVTSYGLIFIALFAIFPLRLLPCFLAGFIVYETILALTPLVERLVKGPIARWISIMFLSVVIILSLVTGITKLIGFLLHDFQNPAAFHAEGADCPLDQHYVPQRGDYSFAGHRHHQADRLPLA